MCRSQTTHEQNEKSQPWPSLTTACFQKELSGNSKPVENLTKLQDVVKHATSEGRNSEFIIQNINNLNQFLTENKNLLMYGDGIRTSWIKNFKKRVTEVIIDQMYKSVLAKISKLELLSCEFCDIPQITLC